MKISKIATLLAVLALLAVALPANASLRNALRVVFSEASAGDVIATAAVTKECIPLTAQAPESEPEAADALRDREVGCLLRLQAPGQQQPWWLVCIANAGGCASAVSGNTVSVSGVLSGDLFFPSSFRVK